MRKVGRRYGGGRNRIGGTEMKNSIAYSARERNRSRAVAARESANRMRQSVKRVGGDCRSLMPGARELGRASGTPRPLAGLRGLESDRAFGPVPAARLRFDAVRRSMPLGELGEAAASCAGAALNVCSSGGPSDRRKAEFAHG